MKAKFKAGQSVWFWYRDADGTIQYHNGIIKIVDENGIFLDSEHIYYDIEAVTDKYPDGCWFKHNPETCVASTLTEIQEMLKQKRNDLYSEAAEFNVAVDDIELHKHTNSLKVGDYIKQDNIYMYITKIESLSFGIRCFGYMIKPYNDIGVRLDNEGMFQFTWHSLNNVSIITAEEFIAKAASISTKFLEDYGKTRDSNQVSILKSES